MKKTMFIFLLLLSTSLLFADGLSGILGIEFGKSKKDVTALMNDKGWKLASDSNDTLTFKKNKGTYANLIVDSIKFNFYEDKFYNAYIVYPYSTKTENVIAAVKAIISSYNLEQVSNDKEYSKNGITTYLIVYTDKNLNKLKYVLMDGGSVAQSIFILEDYSISVEKEVENIRRKKTAEEEKAKSITSDL